MRRPLRYQILLPLTALLLLTLAAVSLLSAWLADRRIRQTTLHQLREVAHTLAESSFPLTPPVLAQARRLSGTEFMAVDSRGRVTAVSNPQLGIAPPAGEPRPWQELELGEPVQVGGQRYFHGVVLLGARPGSTAPESLHLLLPEQQFAEARRQAFYPPLYVAAAAIPLVVLLAWVIAARWSRPIAQLRGQVEEISQGRFVTLPPPERDDELRDLTAAINRMSRMLAEYEREVRASERLRTLGQLGGGIAHQMRNAVTGCRMALDLHLRQCSAVGSSESARETLDVAGQQLERMERYLQRFLALGRRSTPKLRPIDLRDVVAGVLPLVRPVAAHRGVEIEERLPAERVGIEADSSELEQLLINLLLNGLEAAAVPEQGRARPCVRVAAESTAAGARLVVEDNGPGLDRELSELLQPFVSTKPDGAGLGLSVAAEIVRMHAGDLRAERTESGWTRFLVDLPSTAPRPEEGK